MVVIAVVAINLVIALPNPNMDHQIDPLQDHLQAQNMEDHPLRDHLQAPSLNMVLARISRNMGHLIIDPQLVAKNQVVLENRPPIHIRRKLRQTDSNRVRNTLKARKRSIHRKLPIKLPAVKLLKLGRVPKL